MEETPTLLCPLNSQGFCGVLIVEVTSIDEGRAKIAEYGTMTSPIGSPKPQPQRESVVLAPNAAELWR